MIATATKNSSITLLLICCSIKPAICQKHRKNIVFWEAHTLLDRTILFILKYQYHKSRLWRIYDSYPHSSETAQTAFGLFVPFFYFDFFLQDFLSNFRKSCRKKSNFKIPFDTLWGKRSNLFRLCHIFCLSRGDWQPYIAKYP